METDYEIIETYLTSISTKEFPCVAAKEAVARQQVSCFVAGHMACPADDCAILHFIYSFIDKYRSEKDIFHSAAVIFRKPDIFNEDMFESLMWEKLQSLSDLDAQRYGYDKRVSPDPFSEKFSFSVKEEAFFILGLHPKSSRITRQFSYPVLVFNPHAQFEKLRETTQYTKLKNIVRKRDIAYTGSINPMLDDFGSSSEVYQYSGKQYDQAWACPLKINHESTSNYSSQEWSSIPTKERAAS